MLEVKLERRGFSSSIGSFKLINYKLGVSWKITNFSAKNTWKITNFSGKNTQASVGRTLRLQLEDNLVTPGNLKNFSGKTTWKITQLHLGSQQLQLEELGRN